MLSVRQHVAAKIWRSKEWCSQLSTMKEHSKNTANLSYTEYIKMKFPDQMEEMNRQVFELNEQRKRIIINPRTLDFLAKLNHSVLNKASADLITVGSVTTGFVNKESDFDLVFFPKNHDLRKKFLKDFHQNPSFKQNFMSIFAKLLQRESEKHGEIVEKIVELPRLRVPLLIIRYKSGLQMDIQFPEENYHAVRNTHLIRCYRTCDSRFTLLFLWLRMVADSLEIRNSKFGLLSSYHLILLAVHFLQSEQALTPWPVLPVLAKTHPQLVTGEMPIESVIEHIKTKCPDTDWTSHNKMSISELIVRFVDYYHHFNPSKEAIYIEKGLALKRKQAFGDVRLQLMDPYSPVSVCRSPHATSAFFAAISFLRIKLKQGKMMSAFPNDDEVDQFKRETHFSIWRLQMQDKIIF